MKYLVGRHNTSQVTAGGSMIKMTEEEQEATRTYDGIIAKVEGLFNLTFNWAQRHNKMLGIMEKGL